MRKTKKPKEKQIAWRDIRRKLEEADELRKIGCEAFSIDETSQRILKTINQTKNT